MRINLVMPFSEKDAVKTLHWVRELSGHGHLDAAKKTEMPIQ